MNTREALRDAKQLAQIVDDLARIANLDVMNNHSAACINKALWEVSSQLVAVLGAFRSDETGDKAEYDEIPF